MEIYQHTLGKAVSFCGIGLHSGKPVKLKVNPARANHGIRFKIEGRADSMPAFMDRVVDTSLATTIAENDMVFSTTEHLLGALAGLGIDNALVELDAPELPIMDGSAGPFVRILKKANRKQQHCPRRLLKITREVSYREGDKFIKIEPYAGLRISCTIAFDHELIQNQAFSIDVSPDNFTEQIAMARTFGFVEQVERLQQSGYALGGSLENAVVIGVDGVVNEGGLRFNDEFVRHKVLDLLGDLSLLGCSLLGHVTAMKSGHGQHLALMREIAMHPECWEIVELKEDGERCILEKLVDTTKSARAKILPFLVPPVSGGFAEGAVPALA